MVLPYYSSVNSFMYSHMLGYDCYMLLHLSTWTPVIAIIIGYAVTITNIVHLKMFAGF